MNPSNLVHIFISDNKYSSHVWIMPVSEFVEGMESNAIKLCYESPKDCQCYDCTYGYESKLEWALEFEGARMYESIEDALEKEPKEEIKMLIRRAHEHGGSASITKSVVRS